MQNNKIVSISVLLVAIVLTVFLGVETRNAWLQYDYIGKSGRDTINIEGQGKVTAVPDIAQVQLGVVTDGATVKDIQTKNTDKMNAIIKAVKDLGVETKDIQTDNYNLNPKYDWSDGHQKLVGYTVSQNVTVKVRNLDKVGDVVSKGGELGANQIGGVQFVIDDPMVLQAQARDKAIDDAKQKADVLAKKLGLNVARVVSYSEYTSGSPVPMPYLTMAKAMDSSVRSEIAPSIEPGTQDVTANVTVTFEVR
ncbi:MAG: SIMPL domain-containing protein [Patescibacteria group bacterium]|nr:SIMPL domain-containing protein [Patescibacteria group bacterium]